MRLHGGRCLIVGGAHRLGRTLAHDLAAHHAAVAVSSRYDTPELSAEVESLTRAGAAAAAGVVGDVGSAAGAGHLVAGAAAALGGLDALVFAASGPFAPSPPQLITEPQWDASLDTIAKGFFFCACALHDLVMSQAPEQEATSPPRRGVVVAITDCMGLQPWSSFAAHGAAKAAQIHLVKQLARAWAADGVRVCGVAPGPVDLADDPRREATMRAAAKGEWERLVRPEAVGAAVRFCLETDGVTGSNVIVDNGMLLTS